MDTGKETQVSSDISVRYFHNACMVITVRGERILCDPWFNAAYYGTWRPVYEFTDPVSMIGEVDYIWISHVHPDHFDPAFLHEYQDRYKAPVISRDKYVEDACLQCNILIGEAPEWVSEVKSGVYEMDNALIVEGPETTLVNLNDVIYDEATADVIRVTVGPGAIVFAPYTGAGSYPQCWFDLNDVRLHSERSRVVNEHLDRTRAWHRALEPGELFLCAGQYRLVGPLEVLNPFRASIPIDKAAHKLRDIGAQHLAAPVPTLLEPQAGYAWWSRRPQDAIFHPPPNGFTIHTDDEVIGSGPIHIYIDRRLLEGLLDGEFHWNDAGIGSCYFGRREGDYDRKLMDSLEEYHV